MDPRAPQERIASLQQLLDFEEYKLLELRRQQDAERRIPHGQPEMLNPDIRTCEEMIRIWTARLTATTANPATA